MSWKITKKLKETHLAPLANPFSRSSSTSTIVPETPAETVQTPTSATPDPNGIAASTADSSPPAQPSKPGILVVSLHEGKGLKLSEACRQLLEHGQTIHESGLVSRPQTTSFAQSTVAQAFSAFHRPSSSAAGGSYNPKPNHGRYSVKDLPYVMIEFDKQQVFVPSVSGTPESPLWAGDNSAYKFDVSRATEITLSIFLRNLRAPQSAGRSADIMLATCKIKPKLEEKMQTAEERAKKATGSPSRPDSQQGQQGHSGTEWLPIQTVDCALDKDTKQPIPALSTPAFLKVGVTFLEERQRSLSMDNFDLLKVVGKGSFGKVMQVRKKDTHRIYALKSIRKAHIISRSEVAHTLAERSVLAQINNPFIVPLKFSFQSPDKLYLVLAFVNGGELFSHLQKVGKFGWHRARFYAAELLCALECLHGFNIIYRDLKPENILIDYSGHIALCDFGLCKLDMKDQDTTTTFCGTPEYLAPELLNGAAYTKAVDWWTLGVLLFEMLAGLPPFYDENTNEMYQKILHMPLNLKPVVVDSELERSMGVPPGATHEILEKLLNRNATKRLGANGSADIKAHPYFNGIDWRKLLNRQYPPQFKPNVVDQLDTANFDQEFTGEIPTDSVVDGAPLSKTVQQQFAGWSYNRPIPGLGAGESVKDPTFGSFA